MDRNKKTLICCIGDSLTEGDYGISGCTGIPNVKTENYPYFLEKEVNCTVINYGRRELVHFVGRKLKEMFPDLFAETK